MRNVRFSEEQLQDILAKLKITLHGEIRECKALTSNIGQLIRLAAIEKALKSPETEVGGDTVHKLDTFQRMLNEVKQFLTQIEEAKRAVLANRGRMAA